MDIKNIESLAKIMNKNGLSELEFCEGELKISMKKSVCEQSLPASRQKEDAINTQIANFGAKQDEKPNKKEFSFSGLTEITSPIAGVFYASPSADSPPFVKVGDKVKKGDVLCIIEAMKLMNELTAEKDGEIADICAVNEQIVEYGQTLFTIY
ncbi:MAG: acetyl-CoA carboxylase biotin carboxyl carrier protein [Eubacteriales bacterium]|nr:acetyl-CoA carboxylase biotin carboxyl carrier protein [Eubacteriales bacterium]MDD4422037.1 acetyl-CoA carboxylase biotin carboxyl carrier protein [Eubacteriales bacterium]